MIVEHIPQIKSHVDLFLRTQMRMLYNNSERTRWQSLSWNTYVCSQRNENDKHLS